LPTSRRTTQAGDAVADAGDAVAGSGVAGAGAAGVAGAGAGAAAGASAAAVFPMPIACVLRGRGTRESTFSMFRSSVKSVVNYVRPGI
jgi:hypothetical protein